MDGSESLNIATSSATDSSIGRSTGTATSFARTQTQGDSGPGPEPRIEADVPSVISRS
jgi:hypothetical protein